MLTPSIVVLGAPGLGKSTFASTVAKVVPPEEVLLLVAKPGEEKSFGYVRSGLTDKAEIYHDREWSPTLGKFKAGAYLRLYERIYKLQDDEKYGAVIIDPGTDVIRLLEHHILSLHGVGSSGDLSDTRSFYAQLADKAEEFLQQAALLASAGGSKRPKVVIIPWHVQPVKEGEYVKGVRTESADQKARGIEYEGAVLPMIEGKYRRKLAADVDMVLYCDVKVTKDFKSSPPKETVEYVVQVSPNEEKHSKIRLAPGLAQQYLPNDFAKLMEVMDGTLAEREK